MLRVDMLDELGNDFSVGLRFKLVPLVFQKLLDVLVVGDDSCYLQMSPLILFCVGTKQRNRKKSTVVDDNELVVLVRAMGMRVDLVRDSVSGPTGVRNAAVSLVNMIEIQQFFHYCSQTSWKKRK